MTTCACCARRRGSLLASTRTRRRMNLAHQGSREHPKVTRGLGLCLERAGHFGDNSPMRSSRVTGTGTVRRTARHGDAGVWEFLLRCDPRPRVENRDVQAKQSRMAAGTVVDPSGSRRGCQRIRTGSWQARDGFPVSARPKNSWKLGGFHQRVGVK